MCKKSWTFYTFGVLSLQSAVSLHFWCISSQAAFKRTTWCAPLDTCTWQVWNHCPWQNEITEPTCSALGLMKHFDASKSPLTWYYDLQAGQKHCPGEQLVQQGDGTRTHKSIYLCAVVVSPGSVSVQSWASATCAGQIDWSFLGDRESASYACWAHPNIPSSNPPVHEVRHYLITWVVLEDLSG